MYLKVQAKRDLIFLRNCIDKILDRDSKGKAEYSGNLFPAIYRCFIHLWCHPTRLIKKYE